MTATGHSIRPMRPSDRLRLLEIWERSVRATHAFLQDTDVVELRPHVAAALAGSATGWWVLASPTVSAIGFLGFVDPTIEALFIDPDHHRQGAGRMLVAHAQTLATQPLAVDVNEQNPGAVRFYEALGFAIVGRSPTDADGRPFPLLHMRRMASGAGEVV